MDLGDEVGRQKCLEMRLRKEEREERRKGKKKEKQGEIRNGDGLIDRLFVVGVCLRKKVRKKERKKRVELVERVRG